MSHVFRGQLLKRDGTLLLPGAKRADSSNAEMIVGCEGFAQASLSHDGEAHAIGEREIVVGMNEQETLCDREPLQGDHPRCEIADRDARKAGPIELRGSDGERMAFKFSSTTRHAQRLHIEYRC